MAERWSAKRKAGIVYSIRAGTVTPEELYRRYEISAEELAEWERHFAKAGLEGLKASKLSRLRPTLGVKRPRKYLL